MMRYCADDGLTHFRADWPERTARIALPAGGPARAYLLARAARDAIRIGWRNRWRTAVPCAPCQVVEDSFRWWEVTLEACGRGCDLTIEVEFPGALALDAATGNPVVRVAGDVPPSAMVPQYCDPALPVDKILAELPLQIRAGRTGGWRNQWALCRWVHAQWPYRNTRHGTAYCPWRTAEILEWGRRGVCPQGEPVIAMCVHYAVVFAQCCLALGWPARLIALAAAINGSDGHFIAEAWSAEQRKWIAWDPQVGVCFCDPAGSPLNVLELSRLQRPRAAARMQEPDGNLLQLPATHPYPAGCEAALFRHAGVWRWMDFHRNPMHAAVGHGTTPYAETAILWLETGAVPPMFPYRIREQDYLSPPEQEALIGPHGKAEANI